MRKEATRLINYEGRDLRSALVAVESLCRRDTAAEEMDTAGEGPRDRTATGGESAALPVWHVHAVVARPPHGHRSAVLRRLEKPLMDIMRRVDYLFLDTNVGAATMEKELEALRAERDEQIEDLVRAKRAAVSHHTHLLGFLLRLL